MNRKKAAWTHCHRNPTSIALGRWLLGVTLILIGSHTVQPVRAADSIFDDDWGSTHAPAPQAPTPHRPKPPRTAPSTQPAAPPAAPLQWDGVNLPPEAPVPAPPDAVSMPDVTAQNQSIALLRDLYAREYAASTDTGKRSLARRLLSLGLATKNDEAGRCACACEARRLALEAGDPVLAFGAIDCLAQWYQTDAAVAKIEALTAAASTGRPQSLPAFLSAALDLLRQNQAASDRMHVASLVAMVDRLARRVGDPSLRMQAQGELDRVREGLKYAPAAPPAVKWTALPPTRSH